MTKEENTRKLVDYLRDEETHFLESLGEIEYKDHIFYNVLMFDIMTDGQSMLNRVVVKNESDIEKVVSDIVDSF